MKLTMDKKKILLTAVFMCIQCITVAREYRKPQLICPPQVEGRKSSGMQCGIPELPHVSSIEIKRSGITVVACKDPYSCRGSSTYGVPSKAFNVSKTFWVSPNIKSVSRIDEGNWTCSYVTKHNSHVLEDECHLKVLEVPDLKQCEWNVNEEDEIEVACTTDWMYSSGLCVWYTAINGTSMEGEYRKPASTDTIKAVCVMTIQPEIGKHTVFGRLSNSSVWPWPVITAFPQVDINVEPPSNPPVISVAIDQSQPQHVKTIEAEVGQGVLINCSVAGGTPPVHRTILTCQSPTVDTSGRSERRQSGQSVAMTIHVTDQINGTICTCTAQHVTQQYFEHASVVFSDIFPSECPLDLNVSAIYDTAVTLKWTLGSGGGLRQIFFTILQQDITNLTTNSNDDFTSVGNVTDSGEKAMTYTITGLSRNRDYAFSLKVENSVGVQNCTNLQVYASTSQEESTYSLQNVDEIDTGFIEVPPECPQDLEVSAEYDTAVTLQWSPGSDRGLPQKFTILQLDGSNLSTTADSGEKTLTYTVTDLLSDSNYEFSLEVENEAGRRECTDLRVSARTKVPGSLGTSEANVSTTVAVVVIVLIIIAVAAVIAVLVFRRRQAKLQTEKKATGKDMDSSQPLRKTDVDGPEEIVYYAQAEKETRSGEDD